MSTITKKTRKKAHHIPALKIVDTTLQPGKTDIAIARRKNNDVFFMKVVCTISKTSCHNMAGYNLWPYDIHYFDFDILRYNSFRSPRNSKLTTLFFWLIKRISMFLSGRIKNKSSPVGVNGIVL